MNVNEILDKLNNLSEKEVKQITKAFEFAKNAHKDQKRYSREPYFIHPVAATKMLAERIEKKKQNL